MAIAKTRVELSWEAATKLPVDPYGLTTQGPMELYVNAASG